MLLFSVPEPTIGTNLSDEEGSIYNGSSTYEIPITVQPSISPNSLNQQTYVPGSVTMDSAYSESGSDINTILNVSGLLDINGIPREVRGTLILEDDQMGIYNRSLSSIENGKRGNNMGLNSRAMSADTGYNSSFSSLEVKGITSRPIIGLTSAQSLSSVDKSHHGMTSKPISSTSFSNITFHTHNKMSKRALPKTPDEYLTLKDEQRGISYRPPQRIPVDSDISSERLSKTLPRNRLGRNDTMDKRIDKVLPKVYSNTEPKTESNISRSSSSSEDATPVHGSALLNYPNIPKTHRIYLYNEPYDHRLQYPDRKSPNFEQDDAIYGNQPITTPIREQLSKCSM